MNVRLLAPAAAELDEAVAWRAAQAPGLEQRSRLSRPPSIS
jgi:hypothetical protein